MKTFVLLAALLGLTYNYFYSESPTAVLAKSDSVQPARPAVASPRIVIALAPSSYGRWNAGSGRWKTGLNAQTNLKTGPNAQTDFAPFAPSEQATWNQNCGYTIVAGRSVRPY
jgi:hypothetical protein